MYVTYIPHPTVWCAFPDVAQVHRTPPPQQPSEPKTPGPEGAKLRTQDDGAQSWNAVTPPGFSGMAGGRRM